MKISSVLDKGGSGEAGVLSVMLLLLFCSVRQPGLRSIPMIWDVFSLQLVWWIQAVWKGSVWWAPRNPQSCRGETMFSTWIREEAGERTALASGAKTPTAATVQTHGEKDRKTQTRQREKVRNKLLLLSCFISATETNFWLQILKAIKSERQLPSLLFLA